MTVETVDQLAEGGNLVLGGTGDCQAAQEKALQWMAGEDRCPGKV